MFPSVSKHAARLVIAVAAVATSSPVAARADLNLPCEHNGDMKCPVDGANDYEVVYTASTAFTVGQIYAGPSDNPSIPPGDRNSFSPGTPGKGAFVDVSSDGTVTYNGSVISNINVSGNGTDRVTVTYSGTTFSQGQWAHVGIRGMGTTRATIENAYWAINGVPVNSGDGHQAGVDFSGTFSEWLIVRVTDYDSVGNVIGHNWSEAQASDFSLVGNPGVDLYVSYATLLSPTEIPLDQLNEDLTGFGRDKTPFTLSGTPEPSAMVLASVGSLGLMVYAWGRRRRAGTLPSMSPA
jgi:hypothetical protein